MAYSVKIDSEAQKEYKEILEYYLSIRTDLAAEFVSRFDESLARIEQNPFSKALSRDTYCIYETIPL
jgi:mRNA-degrading endonuclease RelE of RelBE toxin-antitoxin system